MKTAFVAGSTKGIGKAIGIDLLKKGYFVYFTYAHDVDTAQDLHEELKAAGYDKFWIHQCDLTLIKDLKYIFDFLGRREISSIDVLVWNVGLTDRTPFGEIQPDVWQRVFEASVDTPFFFIQGMKDKINKDGKIILISSILGIEAKSRSISYGITKAAINMMVPYLAQEFAAKNITVNAVAPGFIDTDWHKGKTTKQIEQIKSECLAKRLGTPEEVSKAVMSIVGNDFINGQVIRIDGGYGL